MSETEEITEDTGMEVDADSSSDSEDEETQLEAKAKELEQQISNYPYSYDSHVELVEIYKKLMNLKEMRTAYERFKDLFPLTPTLWLDWIKCEITVACSEQEKKYVLHLFDLAVKDYLSIDLWLEYVQYSVGTNDTETTRKIFEKSITEAGLHVSKGSLIWDAYREFELAHLACIEASSENWEPQAKRAADVFKRQLSVTLLDMERTYIEWRVWVEKLPKNDFVNKEQVEWSYKNAGKYIDDYKDYEEQILTDEDKYGAYKDYIKYERQPEIIRCLYERAVADFSLKPELWYDYCLYFFKLNNFAASAQTSERALRNCPWSENLWVFHIQSLELSGESHEKITKTLEKALQSEFQSGYQYLQIWLAYLEYYKRITEPSDEKAVEKLRAAFQKAYEHINTNFGQDGDPEFTLLRLWTRIEANFLKNMPEARKIFNDYGILKVLGSSATIWLELIDLEKRFGDEKHLRKTFQRALQNTADWPQCIIQNWVLYERECGTAESMINCYLHYQPFMKKFETENKTQEVEPKEEVEDSNRKRKHDTEKPYYKTKHGKVSKEKITREKVNYEKKVPKATLEKKEEKVDKDIEMKEPEDKTNSNKFDKIDYDLEKQLRSVFISNLDYGVTEKQLEDFLGNIEELRLIKDTKGHSRGYAYAVFPTAELAEKTLTRDRERLDGRPVFLSKCNPDKMHREKSFKYSTTQEKHKLFVRNFPQTLTEEDLRGIFSPYGELKDIRLITFRNGKSKGIAYIEYKNSSEAAKAVVATDNMEIEGLKMSVAISDPPKRKNEPQESHIQSLEKPKSRLQVPLVPRAVQVVSTKSTGPTLTNEDFRKMLLNEK